MQILPRVFFIVAENAAEVNPLPTPSRADAEPRFLPGININLGTLNKVTNLVVHGEVHNVIQAAAGEFQGDKVADNVGSVDPELLLVGVLIQKHSIRSVVGIQVLLDHILDRIKRLERSYQLFRRKVEEIPVTPLG